MKRETQFKGKLIFGGVFCIIVAIGLLFRAFFPEFSPFGGLSVWKLLLGAALLWWIFHQLICGKDLAERLDIFLPLGILLLVFEKELAVQLGKPEDFIHNGAIIVAAILLSIALKCLLSPFRKKHHDPAVVTESRQNQLASSICYLDANDPAPQTVSNRLGEMTVCYQNTETGDPTAPLKLELHNRLGELTVQIPSSWTVDLQLSSSLGEVTMRPNPEIPGRSITVTGSNRLGSVNIRS